MALWRPYLIQTENIKEENHFEHEEPGELTMNFSSPRKSAFTRYHPYFVTQSPMHSPESQESTTQYQSSTSSAFSPVYPDSAPQPDYVKKETVEAEQHQPVMDNLYLHQPYNGQLPYPAFVDNSPPTSSTESRPASYQALKRPFKAVVESVVSDPSARYAAFRAAMLEGMCARNGGSLTVSNPRMRRSVHRDDDDPEHSHRRARNNAAAKRSRDLRKLREDELAIRMAFLERENEELRGSIAAARADSVCGSCRPHW